MAHVPEQYPPRLPSGTQLGPWRVEAWQGQGAYGAVYRAVRVGQEHAGPVALKLALNPWDARFAREAELLSRLSHPSIPRLVDRGRLRLPSGVDHPYFVMEWIEGTPLYIWAQQQSPSHRQVCQVLAQLARALEAVHSAGAVHRDVKGDNVLVRVLDRLPVLIDFGSCHLQGAARLTWQSLPPITPAYLSPQAALFELRLVRQRDAYYSPSPADDLYALGVTAYRLVTGHYPPELQPHQDDAGNWYVVSPDPRPLLDNTSRVQPLLREWILRLLSEEPEQRGTTAQLAQALEAEAARHTEALTPVRAPPPEVVSKPAMSVEKEQPRTQAQWRPRFFGSWLALAASVAIAVVLWRLPRPEAVSPGDVPANPPGQAQAHLPDAGAAAGNSAPSTPPSSPPPPKQSDSQPFVPGSEQARRQVRTDDKGRCRGAKQVVFNGFCWIEQAPMNAEECTAGGYMFLKGKCYGPALEPPQKTIPTSSPGNPR
jgi:serine/threonine protein kinase